MALIVFGGEGTVGGREEEIGVIVEGVIIVLQGNFVAHHAGKYCQHGQEGIEDVYVFQEFEIEADTQSEFHKLTATVGGCAAAEVPSG